MSHSKKRDGEKGIANIIQIRVFAFKASLKALSIGLYEILANFFSLNPIGFSAANTDRCSRPFSVKGGDPAALSSTATLLRLHPPH